jgi:CHASE2 domain-containing sensor protein
MTALLLEGGLLLLWALMATLCCWVPRAVAFFADRELRWAGSWRIASAAMLPGALVMTLAVLLYGAGVLDLIRFGIVAALHLVAGWVYLILSPLSLGKARVAERREVNPFAAKQRAALGEEGTKDDG